MMSLYQYFLYVRLDSLYRFCDYTPVRTQILADTVGKNERRIRETLTKMERAGYVRRRGQRGGWLPAKGAA